MIRLAVSNGARVEAKAKPQPTHQNAEIVRIEAMLDALQRINPSYVVAIRLVVDKMLADARKAMGNRRPIA